MTKKVEGHAVPQERHAEKHNSSSQRLPVVRLSFCRLPAYATRILCSSVWQQNKAKVTA